MADDFKTVIQQWLSRTIRSQELHYKAAHHANYKNALVGVAGIACGIAVALNSLYSARVAIVVPVVFGVGAGFASAAQMIFKWADKSDAHKRAGVALGQIRMKMEQMVASSSPILKEAADEIREQVILVLPLVPRIPFDFFEDTKNKKPATVGGPE